ncbi:MAG: response regulator [Theionarchaea archaeon]|nr:response regulator [Theionarchaea archaeon]
MERISILIVDDDHGIAETLADIFCEMGYDIDVAGNGYKAIEMVKMKIYDASLIDIRMPGINGIETFKQIKRISPTTRVIMMTAYSLEDLMKEATLEGVCQIMYKPLDIDKVVDFIENRNIQSKNSESYED